MRSSMRARLAAVAATLGLILGGLGLSAVPAAAADPLVLNAGQDQDVQVLNPFNSVLEVDFETFYLNYDTLVGFGPDLEPAPGFADKWTSSADGLTWTFHIRDGMKWSDGEPATSEDARYTYQLVLDATEKNNASADGFYLGSGNLEPYLTNSGVTAVSAPDPQTLVVTTNFANTLILQASVPILPKHIWSKYSLEDIANTSATPFLNEPPIVGTGAYQAVEWKPGEFIRFARNKNYWGKQGAADEVIIHHFSSADTMVQALKTGELDYVRGVQSTQFDALKTEANIATVAGISNGYSEIAFNTKGNTDGYKGSTSALTDPKFRDALAWAIDPQKLVDATLGGYGTPGDSIVPPFHARWYVSPSNHRTFDIAEANRRLDAAGYTKDADGKRVDKQGKAITLRVTWPDSEAQHATDAQFIKEWWSQLGIGVDAYQTEEGKLIEDLTPPPGGPANFDIELWGWIGDPDPTSLLNVLRTEEIGNLSDSFWSNARYDELFLQQRAEIDPAKRFEMIKEMQQIAYDEAPYIIMYYDSELHAYRTDKFGGWANQPTKGGTPLFEFGTLGYSLLTDAKAVPTPGPTEASVASAEPTPVASAAGSGSGGGGDSTVLIVGAAVVVVVVLLVILLMRRRSGTSEDE